MPMGADPPRRGDACIYQIKTNRVSLPSAPARRRAPAALVTLDNLGPIARPPVAATTHSNVCPINFRW